MALSYWEKDVLDRKICTIIDTLVERGSVPSSEVCTIVKTNLNIDDLTTISIYAGIKRVFYRYDYRHNGYSYEYNSDNKVFTFKRGLVLNEDRRTFRKERNLIYFDCYDGLCYNFSTKSFNMDLNRFANSDTFFSVELRRALDYEWLFNYTDNIPVITLIINRCPVYMYEKMPAGYIDYINHDGFNCDSLRRCYYFTKYGKFGQFARNIIGGSECYRTYLNLFLQRYNFNQLVKMMNNELTSSGIIIKERAIQDFLQIYYKVASRVENIELNLNRGLVDNGELLQDILDKEKNAILATKLQRLNFINGLELSTNESKYIVVVPQTQADKVAEGKMQNNCVGSYYDDSIMEDRNLIYFVRKADNPKHSYITCRYNLAEADTVEARKFNNNGIYNRQESELIDKISNIIREHFEKEEVTEEETF